MVDKNLKLVSIILPTFNGLKYIRQAINSCLKQSYNNLEIIIVDDGSTENVPDVVGSYFDKRIKYIRHKKNQGLPESLNTGFKSATGAYLTWQSDDNLYCPDAIEQMVNALDSREKPDFVYANFYLINEKGEIIKKAIVGYKNKLDRYCCIGPCFLYRRDIYEKIGGYNPEFILAEDYEYWLRVRQKFKMQKINKFLCYYRLQRNSLTTQNDMAKLEEQAARASDSYIPDSMRYYHQGRVFFYKKDYPAARRLFIKSLFRTPFNIYVWVFLIFVFITILAPPLAEKIIKLRKLRY